MNINIKRISDYISGVEDKWFITDTGQVYVQLKKYSRSYRMITGFNDKGHRTYRGITKAVEQYKGTYPNYLFDNINIIIIEGNIPLEIRYYEPNKDGYKYFSSKGQPIAIHRVVAICFNGCSLEDHIHHKDHNKLNNHHSNLIGLTNSEHAKEHGFGKDSKGGNRPSKYISFTLITPTNMKFDYTDVDRAVLDHDLNKVGLLNILSGFRDSYKGYKVENVVTR